MLGNPKRPIPPIMVSIKEVCELESVHGTMQEIEVCRDIIAYWKEHYSQKHADDPLFNQMLCASTLFTAGRLQGMREERMRRKKKRFTLIRGGKEDSQE